MRTASFFLLTILCLMLTVAPAVADTLYDNGPPNFTTYAWQINYGFSVSNSFTAGFYDHPILKGLDIGVWMFPGDYGLSSVQMDIGTTSFGTDVFSGVEATSSFTDLGINQFGFDSQIVDFSFADIRLQTQGNYWLTLSNAVVPPYGDPIYWDENSGPSLALDNTLGSIPSEAFTLTGTYCYWCFGTVPEPSSIMLFGSGILGLVGVLRRKVNR